MDYHLCLNTCTLRLNHECFKLRYLEPVTSHCVTLCVINRKEKNDFKTYDFDRRQLQWKIVKVILIIQRASHNTTTTVPFHNLFHSIHYDLDEVYLWVYTRKNVEVRQLPNLSKCTQVCTDSERWLQSHETRRLRWLTSCRAFLEGTESPRLPESTGNLPRAVCVPYLGTAQNTIWRSHFTDSVQVLSLQLLSQYCSTFHSVCSIHIVLTRITLLSCYHP